MSDIITLYSEKVEIEINDRTKSLLKESKNVICEAVKEPKICPPDFNYIFNHFLEIEDYDFCDKLRKTRFLPEKGDNHHCALWAASNSTLHHLINFIDFYHIETGDIILGNEHLYFFKYTKSIFCSYHKRDTLYPLKLLDRIIESGDINKLNYFVERFMGFDLEKVSFVDKKDKPFLKTYRNFCNKDLGMRPNDEGDPYFMEHFLRSYYKNIAMATNKDALKL